MSYLGKVALKASDIRRLDVTSSTSATHTLTWTPPNEQSLIITINGVKQQNNYSISGTTLTLDTALVATDEMEVIGINDIGTTTVPGDGTVTTAKIEDDAVTADKLANSINTEIAANTAKVTNATHTGDVTGATALTIAAGAVDLPMLSATGTASATTFLRGDNAWAAPSGGTLVNVVQTQDYTGAINVDGVTSYATAGSDFLVSITPTSTSSTILIMAGSAIGGIDGDTSYAGELKIYRQIASGGYASITASPVAHINGASGKRRPWTFMYLDSPSTTSQVDYQLYMRASDNAVVHFAVDGFSRFITALEIGA